MEKNAILIWFGKLVITAVMSASIASGVSFWVADWVTDKQQLAFDTAITNQTASFNAAIENQTTSLNAAITNQTSSISSRFDSVDRQLVAIREDRARGPAVDNVELAEQLRAHEKLNDETLVAIRVVTSIVQAILADPDIQIDNKAALIEKLSALKQLQ